MIQNQKTYDVLKAIALVWLPAIGTLYYSLAAIWHLPAAEQVSGSVLAMDTFLGVVLKLSSSAYNNSDAKYDGRLIKNSDPNAEAEFNLQIDKHPEQLQDQKEVIFKVVSDK